MILIEGVKVLKNILFCGGGTLGHIYPLVSVVRELKTMGYNLYFIGTTNGLEKSYLEDKDLFIKEYYLDSEGIKRSISLKNIRAIYKHLKNIRVSKRILKELKIDLVIGMGGYISGSIIQSALKLKLKTMIHEQNSVYGLANRLVHKKVDKVMLSFPIDDAKNTCVVGNPRITEIYELFKNNNNYNKGNYVLVVGGSRGAKRINEMVISLKDQFINSNINCLLITGKKYYNENKEKLEEISEEKFKIIDFSNDLPNLLIEAKLVLSRSGASTLSEILALRKVNLLIPSPNVTNNHQEKNAMEIVKMGCGVMLKESGLSNEKLFDTIHKLFFDKRLRSSIVNNIIFNVPLDAKDKFIGQVLGLLNRK